MNENDVYPPLDGSSFPDDAMQYLISVRNKKKVYI